jgi:hypothetical protein
MPSPTPTTAASQSGRVDDPTADPAALIAVVAFGVIGLAVVVLRVKGNA